MAGPAAAVVVAVAVVLLALSVPLRDGAIDSPPVAGTPGGVTSPSPTTHSRVGPTPSDASPVPTPQSGLAGTWQLEAGVIDGRPLALVGNRPVTLVVDAEHPGGTAACNLYGADITVAGGEVGARLTSVTDMLCEEPAMAVEEAYFEALPRVSRLSLDGDRLALIGEGVELRFVRLAPAPLEQIVDQLWLLEALTFDDGRATQPRGQNVSLELRSDGTLHGSTGSRTLTGTWTTYGGQFRIPELAADGDAPPPPLAEQDSHVIDVIAGGVIARVQGDQLILRDPGGGGLVYRLATLPTAPPSPHAEGSARPSAAPTGSATPTATPSVGARVGNIRQIAPGPLSGRSHHSAVWTGKEMIVWGGLPDTGEELTADGAAYDPATDTWRPIAIGPLGARYGHTAVWTGSEMLVWGGNGNPETEELADGAAYDPATDTWRPLADAPTGRWLHSAIWTGSEMVVWGGYVPRDGVTSTGLGYDPVTDTWRALPALPVAERAGHTAAWTGEVMIIWGGHRWGPGNALGDGAIYDPTGGSGTVIGRDHLEPRAGHSAVWTGDRMIVWGGTVGPAAARDPFSDGAAYEPRERWRLINLVPTPGRFSHSAVWTGTEMLVWGGRTHVSGPASADGFAYDPVALHDCRDLGDLPPVSDDSGTSGEVVNIVFTAEGNNEQFVSIRYTDPACRAHPVLGPYIEMLLGD